MKASLRIVALGLLLLVPCASAYAQAPSLSIIPNVSVNAGETKTVNVVAVDVAGRDITLTSALPSFVTLNTPTFGTGVVVTTLSFAPQAVNVGTYTAAVTASAGGVADIEIFQITVNAAGSDHEPVVTSPALKEVTEGANLNFTVTVSDADGDEIEGFMAMMLPSGATFTPSSGSSGVFNWTPGLSAAGEYDVVFSAMAMNGPVGRAVTHIRVANAPTLAITPINDVSVETGSSISVPVIATGLPGALITLTASLPPFATLLAPGTGTGSVTTTISVAPPAGSAGTYHATVTASSNGENVTEPFDIIVTGSGGGENDAPVLSAPSSETVDAGSTLTFDVTATDPDGDHVTLMGTGMPPGSTFLDHANNTGTFTWATTSSQGGTYTASFSGLDGRGGSGSASTQITVVGAPPVNHPPTLTAPLTEGVAEGAHLSFTVTATDQDGDHVTLSATVPSGASFTDQGSNSGVFSWTPSSTQSGVHTAAFSGDDGNGGTGTASTTITVTDVVVNLAPTLSAPLTEQVNEGVNLSFTVTATDPEGDHVTLSAGSVPTGVTFTDQGNNSGVFSWTPAADQSGVYTVTFSGDDGNGGIGTANTTVTVTDVVENHPPTLSAPLTEQVDEGDNLSFTVTAADQDGDHVTLSASSVPTGANFSDNGDNTGAFSWTPGSDQSGVYTVTFSGDDGNGGTGTANTTITVMDVAGGGGEVPGKACLIASFKSRDGTTCFRLKPVDRSFDVRDVVLSSITFVFHGASVPVLSDRARIELHCHGGGGGHDAASLHLGDRHGDDQGEDDDDSEHHDCGGVVCGEHGGHDNNGNGHDGTVCDTLGIRACFSSQALLEVLHGAKMPCDLVHAEIHAMLSNGAMVVATFGKHHHEDGDDDGDDVADNDDGKDKDRDRDKRHHGMNPMVRPNPLNPSTELVFTTSREGRVRVTVYDMQGRLVKSLLDGFRGAGEQSLRWDGSSSRGLKVASGVYYFRIQAAEGEIIQSVAVVK